MAKKPLTDHDPTKDILAREVFPTDEAVPEIVQGPDASAVSQDHLLPRRVQRHPMYTKFHKPPKE